MTVSKSLLTPFAGSRMTFTSGPRQVMFPLNRSMRPMVFQIQAIRRFRRLAGPVTTPTAEAKRSAGVVIEYDATEETPNTRLASRRNNRGNPPTPSAGGDNGV